MKYLITICGILLFVLLGCNFSVNSGKNDELKTNTGDFSGIAVYVGPLDSIRFGA